MRTALAVALFLLLPCASAMASKNTPGQATVQVINETNFRVDVAVFPRPNGSETLGPGEMRTYAVFLQGTVTAVAPGENIARRNYSLAEGQCGRIRITYFTGRIGLSELMPCGESPPEEPPPQASAPGLGRESLLAALCSSGLMGLAILGLLIDRHE